MIPPPGSTVCDGLRIQGPIERPLGASAFGPLLAARDREGESLWLTIVERQFVPKTVDVSRFMAGANALPGVMDEALVPVSVVDREADFCVVGQPAASRAESLAEIAEGGVGPRFVLEVSDAIASAIAALHTQRTIHGLLGPRTIVQVGFDILVLQFGLAELCVPEPLVERTPTEDRPLLAPELRVGRTLTPAADVYAWGAIIAMLSTGEPAGPAIARALAGDLPFEEAMTRLVRSCLAPDPAARPPHGPELVVRLRRAAEVTPTPSAAIRIDIEASIVAVPPKPERSVPLRRSKPAGPAPKSGEFEAMFIEPEPLLGERRPTAVRTQPARADPIDVSSLAEEIEDVPEVVDDLSAHAHDASDQELDGVLAEAATTARTEQDRIEIEQRREAAAQRKREAAEAAARQKKAEREAFERAMAAAKAKEEAERVAKEEAERAALERKRETARQSALADADRPSPLRVRRPGPHGPRGPAMGIGIATISVALAIGLTVELARRAGGLSRVFGMHSSSPSSEDEDTGAEALPVGATGEVELCPEDMAAFEVARRHFCIERGEYPGLRELPRTAVTLSQASELCRERGRRLCSANEWQRACGGPDDLPFPYGAAYERDRCVEASESGLAAPPSRSGARDGCITTAGVYDLAGNVAEWVDEGTALGGDAATVEPGCTTRFRLGRGESGATIGLRRCCLTPAR